MRYLAIIAALLSCGVLCSLASAQTIGTTYVVDAYPTRNGPDWYFDSYGGEYGDGAWHNVFGSGWESKYAQTSQFNAAPGKYRIYACWRSRGSSMAHAGAAFSLRKDGAAFGSSTTVDQYVGSAADITVSGVAFELLFDEVEIAADCLLAVRCARISSAAMAVADAIAFVRYEGPAEPPGVPTEFEVLDETVGYEEATAVARWETGAGPTPDSYTVQTRTSSGAFEESDLAYTVDHPDTYRAFPTMNPGETWQFRVRANKGGLSSAWSSTVTHEMGWPAPTAPTAVDLTIESEESMRVEWIDHTTSTHNGQESGFEIERKDGDGEWELVTTTAADVTSFVDHELTMGTAYQYRVRAKRNSPVAYSVYATSSPSTLLEGFKGGFPDGISRGHLSGAVPLVNDALHFSTSFAGVFERGGCYWKEYHDAFYTGVDGSPSLWHFDPDLYFYDKQECGTWTFSIGASFRTASDRFEKGIEEGESGPSHTFYYTIVVGRNGFIRISSSDATWPGTSGDWQTNRNGRGAFYPAILKVIIDSIKADAGTYPDALWDDKWSPAEKARYDAWRLVMLERIELLYASITANSVNWATKIPRCPGEDFDGGSGGGGGSEIPGGVGSMPGSGATDLPELTKPGKDSKQAQLKPRDFELSDEVDSELKINADPRWLFGTSVFNTEMQWKIDVKEPFKILGPDVNTQMNDAKLWIRAASLVTICIIALTAFLNDFWSY